ncbi:DUF1028 domain-containing protein [Aureisphaera galaxeae]|uniref:DUF1028 domain-containing protein n=1 Tax=Aureisphaera galaxeae TaxID=1538023 RepID=UPI0023505F17|nr:DUF1028 domain-containing protein [Aureisphaera galaxeae]MDC8006329.1 DUF1028 domain-containing protein [Aureisphaera galaxeae]
MKKPYLLLALLFSVALATAQHTFSIVAVDPDTGEIGSAGATCLAFEDGALAISDIVLGVGAIHTQSFWSPVNQANARARMEAGDSPEEIIDWLIANDVSNNPTTRQYNIVDLNSGNPRSAAYTGENCFEEFIHIAGPNYAIAGNILISQDVVNDMETAFLNTEGTLADKLMASLQGAKRPGADERCLSDGVSSLSAFLRVADPSDTDSSYGNLSLDLNVWVTSTVFEPIDALQDAYDATLSNESFEAVSMTVVPNPAHEQVVIRTQDRMITEYKIVDIAGKTVAERSVSSPKNHLYLDVLNYNSGIYFISLFENGKPLATEKLIVQ